jgi:alpha-beta hydrolase superfamily lysophospholipase
LSKLPDSTGIPAVSAVAAALPRLRLEPRVFSSDEQAYLKFYGLDIAGEFAGVDHALGKIESDGEQLAVHVWWRADAESTLLLVHGYFDHVGLFRHMVRFGLERGSNVVAFDLPGHGLSSGKVATIASFDHYRHAIADVLKAVESVPGERQVIAQSTGAAAMMDYLTTQPWPQLDKVVLLAPLVRPRNWLRARVGHLLLHRFRDDLPRGFAENSSDREFLRFVRTDPLQSQTLSVVWVGALQRWLKEFLKRPGRSLPLLVIQGDADGTVDWKYNLRQIERLFPNAKFHTIAGAGHHLVNESASIRSNYLALVDAYLGVSGRPPASTSATLRQ